MRKRGCSNKKHGLHYAKSAKKSKRIQWLFIILLSIVIIIIEIIFYVTRHKKDNISSIDAASQPDDTTQNEPIVENTHHIEKVEPLPETLQGYTIVGKLQIEKINVDKYILGKTTSDSLNVSITKLWGGKINTPGNFSIIGHNRKDQFINLKTLEIGDTFSLISKDGEKVTYQIYNIETVNPNNLNCIESKGDGVREATLITCTPGGIQRLVLKGKEI